MSDDVIRFTPGEPVDIPGFVDDYKPNKRLPDNILERVRAVDIRVRNKAKSLYMLGMHPEKIGELLKIEMPVLNCLINGKDGKSVDPKCWFRQKEESCDAEVMLAINSNIESSNNIIGLSHVLLKEGLGRLRKRLEDKDKGLTIQEMRGLSEIISNLDKIVRLEKGTPTDFIKTAGLTADEAKEILKADPFAFGIVEAECKEI